MIFLKIIKKMEGFENLEEINLFKSQQLFSKNFLQASQKIEKKNKETQKKESFNFLPPKDESKYTLKEGTNIVEGILVQKFLFNGEHSKFYLGYIEQLKTTIMIKSFDYSKQDDNFFDTLSEVVENIQNLSHPNLLSYFDVEIVKNGSTGIILMENFENSISLEKYFKIYNSQNPKSKGLNIKHIKIIMKGILNGLSYLHQNDIYHSELNLKNILISENDISNIKIINYSIKVNKELIQNNPYYSSPIIAFNKRPSYEDDIWSIGCILFELFCGYKPYYDLNAFNTRCSLAQYITPLEEANDDLKDIFYDRKNRVVLDFLNKCFRTTETTRPKAEDLLKHKFFN
jgi:mitogen-activated protein kinase kinase kinase 1